MGGMPSSQRVLRIQARCASCSHDAAFSGEAMRCVTVFYVASHVLHHSGGTSTQEFGSTSSKSMMHVANRLVGSCQASEVPEEDCSGDMIVGRESSVCSVQLQSLKLELVSR